MSILAAKRLYPTVSLKRTERCSNDDDNIADSLLLAAYGLKKVKSSSLIWIVIIVAIVLGAIGFLG